MTDYGKENKMNFLIESCAEISNLPSSKFKDNKRSYDIMLIAPNSPPINIHGKNVLNGCLKFCRHFETNDRNCLS